ncbi:MAG: hypothetical protein AAGG68_29270, partial [Bacteroidota bacterium]
HAVASENLQRRIFGCSKGFLRARSVKTLTLLALKIPLAESFSPLKKTFCDILRCTHQKLLFFYFLIDTIFWISSPTKPTLSYSKIITKTHLK